MTTPLTWIEAPERAPRPNTSLDVIPVHEVSNTHFVGFQFHPLPCGFPEQLPQNCYIHYGPTAGTPKGFDDLGEPVVTDVFGVYQGIECFLNGGLDNFREAAQSLLEAGEHRIVDGRLAGMLNGATATTPATAASIEGAIGLLEQYLALEIPGAGYLYMSPVAATFAASKHLLIKNLDGTLETYLGTPVVVLTEPSAAGFVYASGPVNIWRGPVEVIDAPDWTHNKGRALAERLYTLAIECGAWKVAFAPPVQGEDPDNPEPLTLSIGTEPSSPIPDDTDVTVTVHANVAPTDEVYLWYRINGGTWVDHGEMTETDPTTFVANADGSLVNSGDVVDLYAKSGTTVSPTITINVT